MKEEKSRSIKDAMDIILASCYMQYERRDTLSDVAIPYMVGAPGGGKTSAIKAAFQTQKWGLVCEHFSLKILEEIGGLPQFAKTMVTVDGVQKELDAVTWTMPDILRKLYIECEKYPIVGWLLTDCHLMSHQHNSLLYELFTEWSLRGYPLPRNCVMIADGNHGHNKAGAKVMFSGVMNRVFIIKVHADFKDWKSDFAITNNIHPGVMSFLENTMYQGFFHEAEQVEVPWGSPRAWTRFANLLAGLERMKKDLPIGDIHTIAEGHVSKEAASAFVNYYKIYSRFNIPEIIQNAKNYPIPDQPVDKYALAHALTSYYIGAHNRKSILDGFALMLYKYATQEEDLAIAMVHNLVDYNKLSQDKNEDLYYDVREKLNTHQANLSKKLLKELLDIGK